MYHKLWSTTVKCNLKAIISYLCGTRSSFILYSIISYSILNLKAWAARVCWVPSRWSQRWSRMEGDKPKYHRISMNVNQDRCRRHIWGEGRTRIIFIEGARFRAISPSTIGFNDCKSASLPTSYLGWRKDKNNLYWWSRMKGDKPKSHPISMTVNKYRCRRHICGEGRTWRIEDQPIWSILRGKLHNDISLEESLKIQQYTIELSSAGPESRKNLALTNWTFNLNITRSLDHWHQ